MIILNYLTLWKLWCHNVWKKKCSCSWCNPLGFSILLFPINFFKYTYLDIIIILFCVGRRRVGGVTQFPLAMDNFGFFFGNQNFYHWHLKIMLILFLFNQLKSAAFLIWKAFYFWKEMSSPLLPLPSPPHIPFFLFLLLLPSFSLLSHLLRFNFFSSSSTSPSIDYPLSCSLPCGKGELRPIASGDAWSWSPFNVSIRAAIQTAEWKLLTGDPGQYSHAIKRNTVKEIIYHCHLWPRLSEYNLTTYHRLALSYNVNRVRANSTAQMWGRAVNRT